VMPGVADERERNRARHPRAGCAPLCARARKFGITGRTGRAARQAAGTPFSRDNTPTLASTSTTGAERAESERTQRTDVERKAREERGPQGSPRRATNFKPGCARNLRAAGLSQRKAAREVSATDAGMSAAPCALPRVVVIFGPSS